MTAPSSPPVTQLAWFGDAVGVVSLLLAGVAVARPRALAGAAGVHASGTDEALPVLVRLAAARQAVVGFALLTRRPLDMRRAADLFLPLTVVDAAAVVDGTRRGVLAPRAAAMAVAVLAANGWVAREVRS